MIWLNLSYFRSHRLHDYLHISIKTLYRSSSSNVVHFYVVLHCNYLDHCQLFCLSVCLSVCLSIFCYSFGQNWQHTNKQASMSRRLFLV